MLGRTGRVSNTVDEGGYLDRDAAAIMPTTRAQSLNFLVCTCIGGFLSIREDRIMSAFLDISDADFL